MNMNRKEILQRLRSKIEEGRPVIMGGAGIGLVAKVLDHAGIDILMAYNTGPFRMDGHGSLSGYLAYGDANAITLDLARQILPVVRDTPVIGGIGAADPYRDIDRLIQEYLDIGYAGITNVPTAGLYDGVFRQEIDHTGLGYPREVELIRKCRERDVFTVAYAFNPDEVKEMAQAGADIIGLHVGLTTGGLIGAGHAVDLDTACTRVEEMRAAARAVRDDVIVVAHGGAFDSPENVQECFRRVGVDGFLGASSLERLPVEEALTRVTRDYLDLSLKSD